MKKYYLIIIITLFILNIILSYRVLTKGEITTVNTASLDECKSKVAALEEISWIQFMDSGKEIDADISFESSDNEMFTISELVEDNPVFVYVPEGDCGPCILDQLDIIQKKLRDTTRSSVVYVSSFLSNEDHIMIEKEVGEKILNVKNGKLRTLFERLNQLAIFKIDDKLKIYMLYLPNRPISVYNNRYYGVIGR